MEPEPIYHLARASELRPGIDGDHYSPVRLEEDGFVHCAQRAVVLSVANDYFGQVEGPVLILRIEPGRLGAELRFEAPAPIAGGGRTHLAEADVFPHVYGPIELVAVSGVAVLPRFDDGTFSWPSRLDSLAQYLAG